MKTNKELADWLRFVTPFVDSESNRYIEAVDYAIEQMFGVGAQGENKT